MSQTIFLTASALVYTVLTTIIFMQKDKINKVENRIYKKLLYVSILSMITELLIVLTVNIEGVSTIVQKLFLVCLIIWLAIFMCYTFVVTMFNHNDTDANNIRKYKKLYYFLIVINVVLSIMIFVLPITFNAIGDKKYTSGPSVDVVFATLGIYVVIMTVLVLKNIKEINKKGYYPIITLIILLTIEGFVQKTYPEMLLSNAVFGFIVYMMYHTIENPDVKMLNELYKNKELMEQNYEDKYNFLFELTGEARNPVARISRVCNELKEEKLTNDASQKVNDLSNLVRQLDFSINNILNISSLDIQKLKIVDSKYELEKICYDLEKRIKQDIKEGVEFNLSLPKQIPLLYGDYMKLRQILYSLLINACKNTTSGNISLRVNLIEKYDVARIIFNISDTGSGMSIEKVNEILGATGELDKDELDNLEKKEVNVKVCQKVAKLMGGNLLIKSKQGEGTEVMLTIDQRVFHEKDTSVLATYEGEISNYRKALIIAQDKKAINIIKKKLNSENIACSVLYYGALGIDKIKSGKKYDFIIVEDEMKEMTGYMTYKGMSEIEGFNTPTIIMLKDDKEHIKDHFIKDGFKDTIVLSNIDNDLERIIEKM